MRLLLTGGAGFVGHHLVEGVLKKSDWEIVILDRLDTSGNLERIKDMGCWRKEKGRVKFVWWDLKADINAQVTKDIGHIDYIWHIAASSHVDRSIDDPMSFVMDNVVGTCNILQFARRQDGLRLFEYFSTDEVFGIAPEGVDYKEWDRYNSRNPYSASKAGGEELSISFYNTYGLPVIITHTMNVFGERQHPEKFIPLVIRKVLDDDVVMIHGYKDKAKAGSRFYIHARNVHKALDFLTRHFDAGDKYNIVGEREVDNLTLAQMIADIIGKPLKYEIVDFHGSRPGHDLRYSLDGSKMAAMGFSYPKNFESSLRSVVEWTLKNPKWL